jgi:hypothetical protein
MAPEDPLLLRKSVFLVGGFAASPWLYEELKRRLSGVVDDLKRAESQTYVYSRKLELIFYIHFVFMKGKSRRGWGPGLLP